MALLIEGKTNQFGVNEEYWRVVNININLQYKYCDITMASYVNADARDNGSEPMNIKKIRAKWDDEEFLKYFAPATFEQNSQATTLSLDSQETRVISSNIYERVYDYIKHKDDYFKDATDC